MTPDIKLPPTINSLLNDSLTENSTDLMIMNETLTTIPRPKPIMKMWDSRTFYMTNPEVYGKYINPLILIFLYYFLAFEIKFLLSNQVRN